MGKFRHRLRDIIDIQPCRITVKRNIMKNVKINKEQAITIMSNILREGCSIPMASVGNDGAGLCFFVSPWPLDIKEFVSALRDKSFRVVPFLEISKEFGGFHFSEDYDVCVEFTSTNGDFSEQFLLWNIEYFLD